MPAAMPYKIREDKIRMHRWSQPFYDHKDHEDPIFQKYKGRVVLRREKVKDDSGSLAVFTEQGSSASQMTAAKVTDVIARLPGCARQAADANTQVKMEDAPP